MTPVIAFPHAPHSAVYLPTPEAWPRDDIGSTVLEMMIFALWMAVAFGALQFLEIVW